MLRPRHLLPTLLLLTACEAERPPFGSELTSEPTLFAPGVISTEGSNEYGIAFTRDGREAYFTRSSGGRRGRPRIFVSRVVAGAWSDPEPAAFSTGWEETPFLTVGGDRIIYSSRREVPGWGPVRGSDNLWTVDRTEDGWSDPTPLPGDVNRPRVDGEATPSRSETAPALLSDGTLLYSTEEEPERGSDIYVADERAGRYVNVRPMLLNTGGDEASPAMSPDGRFLVFHGYRDVHTEGDDLFVSEHTQYGWSDPRPLPEPINSPASERFPRFSPDGTLLFFSSDRGQSRMSLYYVSAAAAGLDGAGR